MQCMPVSTMHPASCAARNDLVDEKDCDNGRQCGLLGWANRDGQGDAICSGAGGSAGHCSAFCDPAVPNDCPDGFFCEDPPDEPDQAWPPRCSPN
jgi:hypothetical protein